MAIIDTNMTFSKQVCDLAVGGIIGGGTVLYMLGRLLIILLGFYAVYRITEIFIRRYKWKKTKHQKNRLKN